MEYFWIGTIFQPSILIVNQWLTQKQSQKRIYRCLARSNNGDINSKWKKRLLRTILSGFGTYYTSSPTCSCDNRKRYSTDVITWPNLQRIRRNNDLWNRMPLKFTPLYRLLKVWPAIDRTRVHTSASRLRLFSQNQKYHASNHHFVETKKSMVGLHVHCSIDDQPPFDRSRLLTGSSGVDISGILCTRMVFKFDLSLQFSIEPSN